MCDIVQEASYKPTECAVSLVQIYFLPSFYNQNLSVQNKVGRRVK